MTERIITNAEDVAEGAAWLAVRVPQFSNLLPKIDPLPLRLKPDGFGPLVHAIMGQQVSVASANAIWERLQAEGLTTGPAIAAVSQDALRELGLSRQKARYVHALAEADIDYVALRDAPTDQVLKTLIAVPGIGAWTAEVYAMFSLGRADVFAPGDLALQEGARMIFDLPARPQDKDLHHRITWASRQSTSKT